MISGLILGSNPTEIKRKETKFEGSWDYLGPILIEIEGEKEFEGSWGYLRPIPVESIYTIMFFHIGAFWGMIYLRSSINIYTKHVNFSIVCAVQVCN